MAGDPDLGQFLASLEKTQYLPSAGMRAYQQRLLNRLLRHARAETEFYRDRLRPIFRSDDTVDWDRWTEIPILTRAEAQANEAGLSTTNLPKAVGGVVPTVTSGSTARPLRHYNTDIQNVASAWANERFFRWHGIDPAALGAAIVDVEDQEMAAWPEGASATGWRAGEPDSRLLTLSIRTPVHLQVEWLRRKRPQTIASFPRNLREIARLAAAENAPFSFDAVFTLGEAMSPDLTDELTTAFGVAPLDRYGSTEIGHVAATCLHSRLHHISAELVLIEIVDERGRNVPDGNPGRIVATSFYNFATPMIRYDMGDHGALSATACGCGRTLPTLEQILGRTRNMFHFADGSAVWPILPPHDLLPLLPHRQFQAVQVTHDCVEIRFVPISPDAQYDLERVTALARRHLHPKINVRLVPVDEIAPSASGKRDDYVSLVTPLDRAVAD